MKKKLFNLTILIFFLLISSANSENEFNLTCKGKLIIENVYDTKEEFYYEDIKVFVTERRNIYKTETISTNNWHLRPPSYWGGKVIPGQELEATKDVIKLKTNEYEQNDLRSYGFKAQISLISGMYSGSSKIDDLKYDYTSYYKINAQCDGYQNLYTFINKSETSSEKSKSGSNEIALDYKNYWWVLIILALGAFFLYTKTVPKPKKVKKITKSKPTGFKRDLIYF